MNQTRVARRPWTGSLGLLLGAIALVMALFHFSAGPLDPQPTIGQSIGEIAADIRKSAIKGLKGEPLPEPQSAPWSLDRTLKASAYVLGGLAIVLGTLGFVLKENRRVAVCAVSLGAGAIGFQLFTWMILLIVGVILLVAIFQNLGEILGG
ncbi:hypothetical protein FMN63_17920 [Stappia sp. BW2]|jgi:hypothetical protein|uniref:hypothetical protein n=1 Tax=Stappia sp. BW2 TaxID=2592622 RepID=UPI0011DE990B|nr:hypothetical protein [Stappia sp. BW2]TYC67911.1 hypothetical protein FMN63_17920 [Stappia sp. BW2]